MGLKAFVIGSGTAMLLLSSGLLLLAQSTVSITKEVSFLSILWILSLALTSAVVEELVFRFWLTRRLVRITNNATIAVLISSAVFALLHLWNDNVGMIAIFSHFIGGLVYAVSYLQTGSIWLPIGIHFGWNFTQYFFNLPMSGDIKTGVFDFAIREENSFYGDEYGIESGWFSIILRVLILGTILLIYKNRSATIPRDSRLP